MDKTITARPSWLPWLFHYAKTQAPARLLLTPLMLWPALLYGLGWHDRKGLKQATQRLLMGSRAPADKVERAARSFAEHFGARAELAGALAEISARRAAGDRLVLATASSAFYACHLARRWGFDLLVATGNVWRGGCLTPAIAGENCYGDAKLRLVLAALPHRQGRVAFYSDHVSDLPCLLWADTPVAANPSAALYREAGARGWPIVQWTTRKRVAVISKPVTHAFPDG